MIRNSVVRRYKIRISNEVKERAPTTRSVNELEFSQSIAPEQRAVTAANSISELIINQSCDCSQRDTRSALAARSKKGAPTARSVNELEFDESIAPEQRAVTAANSNSEL